MLTTSVKQTLVVALAFCLAQAGAWAPADANTSAPPEASRISAAGSATPIFSQPPSGSATLFPSSRWDQVGSDYDQYVWDNFTLQSAATIAELRWRGGYDASYSTAGPLTDFVLAIYASIPGGTQPDVANPPLVQWHTGGNAGETPAGTFGGVAMYDYAAALPAPLTTGAGATYWVQIEAVHAGIPNWGLAAGTGGNNQHFRRIASAGDIFYQLVPGDTALTLLGSPPNSQSYLPLVGRQ